MCLTCACIVRAPQESGRCIEPWTRSSRWSGRWLSELVEAIEHAQTLAWRLGVTEGDSEEARELYARLETVRAEVETLRFGDWVDLRTEIDLAWIESLLPDGVNLPYAGT